MKKIILIANTKGGCGKSTLTVNLAAEMARRYPVRVIDTDFQHSTSIFNHNRKKADLEPLDIIPADGERLKKEIADNDRIMIIDTGAFDTPEYRGVILKADMVICPTTDSSYDLYGLLMFSKKFTGAEFKKAKKNFKLFILANRIEPRTKGYAEIESFVEDNKKVMKLFETKLHNRADYKTAFDKGMGVTELSRTQAGKEIKALLREVEECLKIK